ncbi:hypothetical protein HOI71_21100, partial [Candidatus Poribacteria bacterium]|nr:hypothetical protein [Candidatus Poribacteria bacterium]
GAPCPTDKEGVDLAPFLRGETDAQPSRVFAEMASWCMVRDGDWKLVAERPGVTPSHLFDLATDPYELNNLVASPRHSRTRGALLDTLREWDARVRRDA